MRLVSIAAAAVWLIVGPSFLFGNVVTSLGFRPGGFTTDARGNIFVTDVRNDRVAVYAPDGSFQSAFGSPGMEPGTFDYPGDIVVDLHGTIYVADANRVQAFDANGQFARPVFTGFADSLAVDPSGNLYVLDGENEALHIFDPEGGRTTIDAQGFQPASVAVFDSTIYLSNRCQVRAMDAMGQTQFEFGACGTDVGQFSAISDLHVDAHGITISDRLRVQMYDHQGQFQFRSFGHQVADGTRPGNGHDLFILESDGHLLRSIDRSTLQGWDGRVASRDIQGPFRWFDLGVDANLGLDALTGYVEDRAETFVVPGRKGELVDLTFRYEFGTGFGLLTRFGVFDPNSISADPSDRLGYLREVSAEGDILIDERLGHAAGHEVSYTVPAGTELAFFLYPYGQRYMNYSIAEANAVGLDQMLAFIGDEVTYLAFEDLQLSRGAEFGDFTDMFLSVNASLIPVPEPTEGIWAFLAFPLLAASLRHLPHRASDRSSGCSSGCSSRKF